MDDKVSVVQISCFRYHDLIRWTLAEITVIFYMMKNYYRIKNYHIKQICKVNNLTEMNFTHGKHKNTKNLYVWFVVAKQISSTIQVTDCLGTHVTERANNLITRDAGPVWLDCLRNPKVNQLHYATSQDKICRFQVRMHDSCRKTQLFIVVNCWRKTSLSGAATLKRWGKKIC